MNNKTLALLAGALAVTGCALMPLKAFKKANKEAAGKQVATQSSERRKPAEYRSEVPIRCHTYNTTDFRDVASECYLSKDFPAFTVTVFPTLLGTHRFLVCCPDLRRH